MGGGRVGGRIHRGHLERDAESGAELLNGLLIPIRRLAANPMMDVDGGQTDAQRLARQRVHRMQDPQQSR